MADDVEKLEMARVVSKTHHLLHRLRMKQAIADVDTDSMPALTLPQVNMVMTVRDQGPMTIKQITQVLRVKAPAASAMVERLVELGMLTRRENPADRREVLVEVSPEHELKIQEMERRHLQLAVELFDKIGMEDARTWARVCGRIQEALNGEMGQ
jgi:DNA-binding MarR family transcriptional regulator